MSWSKPSKGKGRRSRVEAEKERQLKVLQEKLKAPKHGIDDSSSSSEKDDSSDEGAGLKKVRKSLSKKAEKVD